MTMTKQAFFKPEKISARDKAATTSEIARQIIETERADQTRKTARLRQLREAQPVEPKPVRPTRRRSNSGLMATVERSWCGNTLLSGQCRPGRMNRKDRI
ncbi:MAG TPA: hypothetical protein VHN11_23170 [Xanthobacteraceae bacterium]|jgi:hypothetical protein|nr:hypothetical protein [Xanthobacteraceae bacterium]